MNRNRFLKNMVPLFASVPLMSTVMKLNELSKITANLNNTEKMPVLFLGHGNPMNAIEDNEFVQGFRKIGNEISKPNFVLCVSAHWETKGTFVTAMKNPKTIHDFGGFPKALFDVEYPAKGSPELALTIQETVTKTVVGLDENWGLDHGTWSVVKHLYPNADVPVLQLSIDYTQPPEYHFELAKQLADLRNKGVLIIGSGNIIHNLGLMSWDKINQNFAFDWAEEASEKIKKHILCGDFQPLVAYHKLGRAFELAIPTPEHYLPLLYTLALKNPNENVSIFNDKPIAGSLSMTSLKIGMN